MALGRHTVTGLLTAQNRQAHDWTADYRFYQRHRAEPQALFAAARETVEQALAPGAPLVVGVDDSLLPKTGCRVAGAAWRRDPQGPPFQVQFAWAQRMLQFSAALPLGSDGAARLVPIDFLHAPTPVKPPKDAEPQETQAYAAAKRQASLVVRARDRLATLRQQVPAARAIHLVGDGGYSKKKLLRHGPSNTVYIGRIRKDSALFEVPAAQPATGRKRCYGPQTLTPEALRTDEAHPWQTVTAYACGKKHAFQVKVLTPVRSPLCGGSSVAVVVIKALGYRLRKGGKLLYRQPAYLLGTDPTLPVEQVVQEYLWRWDIEVNLREEKTLLGVGQAQVRQAQAVATVPALAVAAYALLLLAAYQTYGPAGQPNTVPWPKWRQKHPPARATTARLINQLRYELWAHALKPESLTGFVTTPPRDTKPEKPAPNLASTLFHATN